MTDVVTPRLSYYVDVLTHFVVCFVVFNFRRQYLNAIDLSGASPFFSCIKMKRYKCTFAKVMDIRAYLMRSYLCR